MINPIFVALDVDDLSVARTILKDLKGLVGGFKIGPRLNLRYGQNFCEEVAASGELFLDNKFLDIPSTMVASVEAAFQAGASYVTVHAWAGPEALTELALLEKELCQKRPFKILVVTILTSFQQKTLPYPANQISLEHQITELADSAWTAGLSGVVCSPLEAALIKRKRPDLFIVTPGIRLDGGSSHDQKRIQTPLEALRAGASALVIGRPILESTDRRATVRKILESCSAQGLSL